MGENYLQKYQRLLGLAPDGKIGPKTLAAIMADLRLTNKVEAVMMLGQMQLESGGFTHFRENLNYNEAGLLNIFRKYYVGHPDLARLHARKPELIANYVYANRMQNGDPKSGDGWKYRGGLGIQVTGKRNWQEFFRFIGKPENTDPDSLISDAKAYFQSGSFFFRENNLGKHCTSIDKASIMKISKAVNLGNAASNAMPHGAAEREGYTLAIAEAVGLA